MRMNYSICPQNNICNMDGSQNNEQQNNPNHPQYTKRRDIE